MPTYGVTPTGFVRKPYEVIVEEMRGRARALWGSQVNLAPDALIGQLIDTCALKVAEEWEVSEAAYAAADPDQAEDAALDAVAAITGTTRDPATYTRVLGTVNVDPGTYAAGALVASVDGDPSARYANLEAVVNATAGALSIGSVIFVAEETGPRNVLAGTLTVMASAVSGWNSVTNVSDAYVLGTNIEGNESLRAKREDELGAQGSTNADAIRADLLQVENVLRVTVLQNDTDTTDGNGLLPHSIEAIVYGPSATDAAIAAAIFASKAGGVNTNGTTTVQVTDEQGFDHPIKFTRPTTLRVYVEVTVETDDTYPIDGDDLVAASMATTDVLFGPGTALRWTKVIADPYPRVENGEARGVAGVVAVTDFGMSTNALGPFLQADIVPTIRQVVSIDSADVTVTS